MSRSWREHPLAQLTIVRFLEFVREPEAVFWVFIFPILLAAALGVAFRNRPPTVLKVGSTSSALAATMEREGLLDSRYLSDASAHQALRNGEVILIVRPGAHGSVVFEYDNTNPDGRNARMLANRAIQEAAGRLDPVLVSDRIETAPGSRYIDFLIPGLIGMNLMGSSIWGIGYAIVDARRKKLIRRLVATPMPRTYYLLSFMISRLVLLVLEVGAVAGFGVMIFHVPLRGPLWVLAVLCVLGTLTFSALGLLISSRVRTIEAASGLMNLVMMPMWIVSGVFFSSEQFPAVMQPFVQLLPLTAIVEAVRANMLQGAGSVATLPQIAVMGAWLLVCFPLALKLFRWR